MQTAAPMAKDQTFNLRLDEKDRARLDDLCEHFSAPAATVVRMLIKAKHDEVMRERDLRASADAAMAAPLPPGSAHSAESRGIMQGGRAKVGAGALARRQAQVNAANRAPTKK